MARQGILEFSNLYLGLAKWGLILFNVAFFCIGVVSLSVGLWLYITNNEYATLSEGKDLLGSVFLIAVGFGVIIVGFLGIVAAVWESFIISLVFCGLVGLAMGMYLAAGIWAFAHGDSDSTRADVEIELNRTIIFYERNQAYRESWDALQGQFNCCGIAGMEDWGRLQILFPPRIAPDSCCLNPPVLDGCGLDPVSLQAYRTEGCIAQLVDYEQRQYDIIGPIGIAFGLFQVFGILLSIVFIFSISVSKDSYSTR